ncbi:MAG: LLM class F420-dependent oxidoreductase [Actinomycetota bacterium]
MELRIFTEPQQGATYDQLLAVARTAEQAGFGAFFRSDHYLKMGDVTGLPGPTDAWVTLAGLARDTDTIRLGTLVSPATFYRPGPLAVSVAQVDQMSGGRIEFGFGTGWYEAEHHTQGLDFPPLGTRFDMLEEYLEQITGLWATPDGETFSHEGRFHTFTDSPGLPKPTQQPGPPIIIGGRGPKRTPALTARYAAEFNQPFVPLDQFGEGVERVRAACEAIGRDPDEVIPSAALVLCLGADEATVVRRAAAIGREPTELRENGAAGSVDEVTATIAAYGQAGCRRIYLQVLDLSDLDHVAEAGAALIPAAAAS